MVQKRKLDITVLRGLRRKFGVSCPKGTELFSQGQESSEFYVVLQGKVELWIDIRDSSGSSDGEPRKQILAEMEPGDFFGEMAAFTREPRSASATTVEDTSLLYFDERSALTLLGTSPMFGLGIIQSLCDRIRGMNIQLAEIREQYENAVTSELRLADEQHSTTTADDLPIDLPHRDDRPPPSDQLFLVEEVTCPICRTDFKSPIVKPAFATAIEVESDFREVYRRVNPIHYSVRVCPNCYYAAFADDFLGIEPPQINEYRDVMGQAQRENVQYNFWSERTVDEALRSYELATVSYELWPTLECKKATIWHMAAWIAREMGDVEIERQLLAEALERFQQSYGKEKELISESMGTVCAKIADILVRLDRVSESPDWFNLASQSEEAKRNPALARKVRDRFREVQQSSQAS